ncbi:MAG: hypothetical protein KKD29_00060 [Candidatus Omnitrophica bacterium]|nr:hypothetical protein [Candidatus Omnitrophota bacterium]MBU4488951.1 hypothetical protein [Candidatus Omnitrophota bacterium]
MIKLDISQAVFLYLLFSVIGVFLLWIFFEEKTKLPSFGEEKFYVWQCSICTHTYVDSINSNISKCPLCQSLNERKKEGGQDDGSKRNKGRAHTDSFPAKGAAVGDSK